ILIGELLAHQLAVFECFSESNQEIVVSQHLLGALKVFKRLEERLKILPLIEKLGILLIQDCLQWDHLIHHHAEDSGDRSLAGEVFAFGEFYLPPHEIDQVFSVTLIENGEIALNACLLRKLS